MNWETPSEYDIAKAVRLYHNMPFDYISIYLGEIENEVYKKEALKWFEIWKKVMKEND